VLHLVFIRYAINCVVLKIGMPKLCCFYLVIVEHIVGLLHEIDLSVTVN